MILINASLVEFCTLAVDSNNIIDHDLFRTFAVSLSNVFHLVDYI